MADDPTPNDILDEFWQAVFNTYETYCTAWQAIFEWGESLKNSVEDQEIASLSYCRYIPASMQDKMNDIVIPQFPYHFLKERNKLGGINQQHIGNMCVVTIYQYWEDHYRGKLANALRLESKNCIAADIFGDIKALRDSVIHSGGKAIKDIPQKSSEKWFKKGDSIIIDKWKF